MRFVSVDFSFIRLCSPLANERSPLQLSPPAFAKLLAQQVANSNTSSSRDHLDVPDFTEDLEVIRGQF